MVSAASQWKPTLVSNTLVFQTHQKLVSRYAPKKKQAASTRRKRRPSAPINQAGPPQAHSFPPSHAEVSQSPLRLSSDSPEPQESASSDQGNSRTSSSGSSSPLSSSDDRQDVPDFWASFNSAEGNHDENSAPLAPSTEVLAEMEESEVSPPSSRTSEVCSDPGAVHGESAGQDLESEEDELPKVHEWMPARQSPPSVAPPSSPPPIPEEEAVAKANVDADAKALPSPDCAQQEVGSAPTPPCPAEIARPVVRRRSNPAAEWLREGLWSIVNLAAGIPRLMGTGGEELWYAVQTKEGQGEVYAVLRQALEPLGWRQVEEGSLWNLLWTWQQPVCALGKLLSMVRVNHFKENKHLTRKDYLKRSQDRYVRFSRGSYFRIYPETFILPKDYTKLIEAFAERPGQQLYIMKPVGSSRGRGVKVIHDLAAITYSSACIVQKYIERPVLYKGFKFDLRIYVLVKSFTPTLEAYIYKRGFARLATVPYTLDEQGLGNKLIHVTNVAVQTQTLTEAEKQSQGTKLSLDDIKYAGCFGTPDVFDRVVWPRIKEVVVKALIFAAHNIPPNANCFELFGFDLLVERDSLRVWLLEVNSSPSMSLDTRLDQEVKVQLIRDTVLLVDPIRFNREMLAVVLEKRRGTRVDRVPKLTQDEAQQVFCQKSYANSFPDSCEIANRRLGDFELLAPSPLYDQIALEARTVVNT